MKSSHPSGFTSQEMLEELMRAIENPNSQIAGKGLLATMADPIKTMMGQVKETYQAQGLRKAAKQALFGGELPSGGSATGLLNFWEVRGGLSPGDAKRNMGAVDANGKLLDTLDRWKSQETRILPMQIGEQLSAYVEFQNRMQPFLYLLRKGWNPHAAALKVKELHFDYGSLNSFEKKVLRRNIMFYDFMRKNLELQAKLLFHNPGGTTSKIVRAENRLQEESKGQTALYHRTCEKALRFACLEKSKAIQGRQSSGTNLACCQLRKRLEDSSSTVKASHSPSSEPLRSLPLNLRRGSLRQSSSSVAVSLPLDGHSKTCTSIHQGRPTLIFGSRSHRSVEPSAPFARLPTTARRCLRSYSARPLVALA